METIFFKIIIANYNSEMWIDRCIQSILNQTYPNFFLIIVDDISTDNSVEKIEEYARKDIRIRLIKNIEKKWNGGSRNIGVDFPVLTDYTLFMDCDDWLNDKDCLQKIVDTIQKNNNPDCVRLPYIHSKKGKLDPIMLTDSTPKDLVNSCFIAPWTKIVKSKLIVKFPENTMIEDVTQHIAQYDVLETVVVCDTPIICWNRDNPESASLPENLHKNNSKRVSSVFRQVADLMDLECKHDYCEEQRKWRLKNYRNLVREGKEENIW